MELAFVFFMTALLCSVIMCEQVSVGFWEECLEALEETFLCPRAGKKQNMFLRSLQCFRFWLKGSCKPTKSI